MDARIRDIPDMFEEIREKIEQHLRSAFALLPDELVLEDENSQRDARRQNWLVIAYKNHDGEQVLLILKSYCQTNNFEENLLQEIEAADRNFRIYQSLGMKNSLDRMSECEIRTIGECLNAAASGPFFPDWEFATLFGLKREEVEKVANEWPSIDIHDENVGLAINNSMNMLLGYPHRKEEAWNQFISVSPKECYEIFKKWRILSHRENNQISGKAEFFQNSE